MKTQTVRTSQGGDRAALWQKKVSVLRSVTRPGSDGQIRT
ncbi:hypothetical protein NBRC3257_2209 [Gluconobacter thailandicus NBRC 3257]|uniref:Uncharacterized protein n=1 Tax=Gluconobacter thailandicus NBRC 3257 TaxID=1381097 RepID=A0ABQ0IYE0_GLUTH|nr:hypothetical protein NBRC3255_2162 [Gluconobacter thailandicus NBRC 3255]GAD27210.1 hypothetical protein NBRC3257_2209 [Gluconobacter thailandicus NBRC 3257]